MTPDDSRPPAHLTYWQGIGYRALFFALFFVGMYVFAVVAMPIIDTYVATPFGYWVGDLFYGAGSSEKLYRE